MKTHESKPYNPDIANVFYRAGYIERWGRGIEKICDACKELGADLPIYELRGNGLRVHFAALQSALIKDSKALKHQSTNADGALEEAMVIRIIEILRDEPAISQEVLAERLGITRRVVQKKINYLKTAGRIERVGGKRYGHWRINE